METGSVTSSFSGTALYLSTLGCRSAAVATRPRGGRPVTSSASFAICASRKAVGSPVSSDAGAAALVAAVSVVPALGLPSSSSPQAASSIIDAAHNMARTSALRSLMLNLSV